MDTPYFNIISKVSKETPEQEQIKHINTQNMNNRESFGNNVGVIKNEEEKKEESNRLVGKCSEQIHSNSSSSGNHNRIKIIEKGLTNKRNKFKSNRTKQ